MKPRAIIASVLFASFGGWIFSIHGAEAGALQFTRPVLQLGTLTNLPCGVMMRTAPDQRWAILHRASQIVTGEFHATVVASSSAAIAPWIPDRGDGTYQNPVLFADYSDPDAVRVGDDFYLVSSSFDAVPGLPILHSKDLVNWTIIGHVFAVQTPADHFSVVRHGEGVWAPAIRWHDGKFWIFYPDPDFGIYFSTATNAADEWTPPQLVKAGKGLIDPCPFWDDDGQLYLVHGWAKSRAGIANLLTLHKLSRRRNQSARRR